MGEVGMLSPGGRERSAQLVAAQIHHRQICEIGPGFRQPPCQPSANSETEKQNLEIEL